MVKLPVSFQLRKITLSVFVFEEIWAPWSSFEWEEKNHDALKASDNVIMYLAHVRKKVGGEWVYGDEIRAEFIRFSWVFWRWNTFNYLPLEYNCSECMPEKGDWTHCNSITLAQEAGGMSFTWIYLDIRNLNQVIKIDCKSKNIIWKLGEHGDFKMFEKNGTEVPKLFSHQHDPEILPNGNILLFDNGLHRGGPDYSRVIEIEITT